MLKKLVPSLSRFEFLVNVLYVLKWLTLVIFQEEISYGLFLTKEDISCDLSLFVPPSFHFPGPTK